MSAQRIDDTLAILGPLVREGLTRDRVRDALEAAWMAGASERERPVAEFASAATVKALTGPKPTADHHQPAVSGVLISAGRIRLALTRSAAENACEVMLGILREGQTSAAFDRATAALVVEKGRTGKVGD